MFKLFSVSTRSTRSTRLKDLTPTVEKAASATAAAVAPRIQPQHLIAFAAGSFGVWENTSEFQDLQYSKTPSSESNGLEL
jgi:hypothetical protein